ncbi:MAG TPA: DUF835 domain-containing protein [Methanomassiliicoccales archaeon]|nr:DUF835 domain-containing protein [Methanomassiliicoccales archaeon]
MKVSKGMFYLFEERVPLRTHQVVRKELSNGRKALYISKNAPELLRSQLDFDMSLLKTKWLSPRTEDSCIPPMNLEIFEREIKQFFIENEDGIVVLNGLDVLEKWNGWRPVLDVLRRTEEALGDSQGNIIISLDPKSHYPLKLKKLEILSDEVVSSCS